MFTKKINCFVRQYWHCRRDLINMMMNDIRTSEVISSPTASFVGYSICSFLWSASDTTVQFLTDISEEYKTDEFDGQDMTSVFYCWGKAVCGLALSCWNMKSYTFWYREMISVVKIVSRIYSVLSTKQDLSWQDSNPNHHNESVMLFCKTVNKSFARSVSKMFIWTQEMRGDSFQLPT